jgi:hypothetical protein
MSSTATKPTGWADVRCVHIGLERDEAAKNEADVRCVHIGLERDEATKN